MSDLEGLARELELRARQTQLIGDQLVRAAAIAIWTSVAADAFRAQVSRRRRDIAEVAGMLRSAASSTRQFARDAEAEKARLRRLEETALHGAEHPARAVEQGAGRLFSWVRAW